MKYYLKQDLVIPAGTEITVPPTASSRWGKDHEAVVHLHKDLAGYLSMDIREATFLGIVRAEKES